MLFQKSPSYTHLKVFGCLYFASTLDRHRSKFDPRAARCVFLGYPSGYKGYKVLNIATQTISISRDVIFHENVFPFSHLPSSHFPEPQFTFPITSTAPPTPPSVPHLSTDITPTSSPIAPPTTSPSTTSPALHDSVDDTAATVPDVPVVTTKSGRVIKPPSHLSDYICNSLTCSPYPIHQYISYSRLSSAYFRLICSISSIPEPSSYHQASLYAEWRKAMQAELEALIRNNTWFITLLPPDKIAIGCKWVFRTKLFADGTLDRYKARLVAKGYTQ